MVFIRFADFHRGRTGLDDEQCSDRPTFVMHEETLAALEQLMKADARITCSQMEVTLDLSSATLTGSSMNIFV